MYSRTCIKWLPTGNVCILLTRNHMIFLVHFGINKHLLIFSKITNCTSPTGSCNFVCLWKNLLVLIYSKLDPNCTRNHAITSTNYFVHWSSDQTRWRHNLVSRPQSPETVLFRNRASFVWRKAVSSSHILNCQNPGKKFSCHILFKNSHHWCCERYENVIALLKWHSHRI